MTEPAVWRGTAPLMTGADDTVSFWSSGYAVDPAGNVLSGTAIGRFLVQVRHRLDQVVPQLNGCFAAVLRHDGETVLVTDRFGTVPLYLVPHAQPALVSPDPWPLITGLSAPPRLDPLAFLDIVRCGYVTGDRTLIEGIETVPPAAIVRLTPETVRSTRYWHYGYVPESMDEEEAVDGLAAALEAAVGRCGLVLRNWGASALLPLSGGLDSRILAALFAKAVPGGTAAVSYGSQSDPEIQVARDIATELHMEHHAVPLDSSYLNEAFLDRSVREVGMTTRFTCGVGARHFSGAADRAFVPGHTGDFVSGRHLPPQVGLVRSRAQLIRFLYLRHFRFPTSETSLKRVLHAEARRHLWDSLQATTAGFDTSEDMLGLIDRWNVENRQRRLILMELRAYEANAPWLLPFYDHEVIDFFSRIPHRLRLGQYLYIRTAVEKVFKGDVAALGVLSRVGGTLSPDHSTYERMRSMRKVPVTLAGPMLRALPVFQMIRSGIRRTAPAETGPDPILHWFRTCPEVRTYLLDKVEGLSLDPVRPDRLRACMTKEPASEGLFNRFLPAVITAQEVVNQAEKLWRSERKPSRTL